MKNILIPMLIAITSTVTAQNLHFRTDSTFKIVQFTDTHFEKGKIDCDSVIILINNVLDWEKPDLVVLSGDIVTGDFEGWSMILEPIQRRKLPFAVVLGNHDDEQIMSRNQILDHLTKEPFSLTQKGDYTLVIGDNEALIYMLDSNGYSTRRIIEGYDWFSHDQVQAYIETSRRYARMDDGEPLPALAFFHIPLPEYAQARVAKEPLGNFLEKECPPAINTGMFAAMLLSGDVMGCFVGHDHSNDYLAQYFGVTLGYGRFSGSNNTYHLVSSGARVFTMYSGRRKFDTHLRLADGKTEQYFEYGAAQNDLIVSTSYIELPAGW